MADVIRIKRRLSGAAGTPAALANAELAFNEVDNTLYYGKGDDGSGNATSIVAIGGTTRTDKTYVDAQDNLRVLKAGDVMTGALTLPAANPTVGTQAAHKNYVDTKQPLAEKGVANGYASLDASAKVPATQLPAYVDDVLEYANLAAFPTTGVAGIIYVALDTNKIYRWSGSTYIEISPSPGTTDAVPEGSVNKYYTDERVDDRVAGLLVAGANITLTYDDVGNTLTIVGAAGGASTAYVDAQDALRVLKAGDTMTGALVLPAANPTAATQAAHKGYVDQQDALRELLITIGTTAQYWRGDKSWQTLDKTAVGLSNVDNTSDVNKPVSTAQAAADALRVLKAGDTMTGALVLPADPTTALQAATKQYVDSKVGGGGSSALVISDTAPSTPTNGMMWWESDTGILWTYYNDGTSSQWVQINAANVSVPPNTFVDYTQAQTASVVQQDQARKNIYAAPLDLLGYSGVQVNGGFEVSQETPPFNNINYASGAGGWPADQWLVFNQLPNALVVQNGKYQNDGNGGIQRYITITSPTAQPAPSAGQYIQFRQAVEGYRISRLNWGNVGNPQPLTVCFLVRGTKAGQAAFSIRNDPADRSYVAPFAVSTVFTWVTITIPPDTTANKWQNNNGIGLYLTFCFISGTTYQSPTANAWVNGNFISVASTSNFFDAANSNIAIAAFAILPGNVVPADIYQYANMMMVRSFDQELQLCKRYYQKSYDHDDAVGAPSKPGYIHGYMLATSANTVEGFMHRLPVPMRAAPAITFYRDNDGTVGSWRGYTPTTSLQNAAPIANAIGQSSVLITTNGLTGLVSGQVEYWGHATFNARI